MDAAIQNFFNGLCCGGTGSGAGGGGACTPPSIANNPVNLADSSVRSFQMQFGGTTPVTLNFTIIPTWLNYLVSGNFITFYYPFEAVVPVGVYALQFSITNQCGVANYNSQINKTI